MLIISFGDLSKHNHSRRAEFHTQFETFRYFQLRLKKMYGPRNPLLSTTRYHLYFDLVNANNLKMIRFQAKVIVESQDRSTGFECARKKKVF